MLGNWKTKEHESDGDTNCNQCTWYNQQTISKGTGGVGNKRTSGKHLNYSIIKIGQNTEESARDLKTLAVTQTPVEKPSSNAGMKNFLRCTIIKDHTTKLFMSKAEWNTENLLGFWDSNKSSNLD